MTLAGMGVYPNSVGPIRHHSPPQKKRESLHLTWLLLGLSSIQWGFFYGLFVSAILALGSFYSLRWAMSRSHQIFLKTLLGGMLARLVIIGIAMIWVWKFSTIDALTFTVTLLISYIIFQIIEIVIVQKQFRSKGLARPAGK
jgi:hypothetical protein